MQKKQLVLSDFFSLEEMPFKEVFFKKDVPWSPLLFLTEFFEKFNQYAIHSPIPEGTYLEKKELIYIGANTKIEPGVFIKGPCYIGENCEIRHGAYLREHVFLSSHALIGHATEVKHSFLFPHAKAAHFAYIGDSVLGRYVNLGAGVKCANLRMDEKPISLFVEGTKIYTHLKKMGAILGDGVQVGCNTVLNPGTMMGKNSLSYPSLNISGYFPFLSVAKPRAPFRNEKKETLSSKEKELLKKLTLVKK